MRYTLTAAHISWEPRPSLWQVLPFLLHRREAQRGCGPPRATQRGVAETCGFGPLDSSRHLSAVHRGGTLECLQPLPSREASWAPGPEGRWAGRPQEKWLVESPSGGVQEGRAGEGAGEPQGGGGETAKGRQRAEGVSKCRVRISGAPVERLAYPNRPRVHFCQSGT